MEEQQETRVKVDERSRRGKIVLRLITIIISFFAFWMSIGVTGTICNASPSNFNEELRYYYDNENLNCANTDNPEQIILTFLSFVWSIIHIRRLRPSKLVNRTPWVLNPIRIPERLKRIPLPKRPAFTRRVQPHRARFTHPGWYVAFDLLLWLGLLGVGVADFMGASTGFGETMYDSDGSSYGLGQRALIFMASSMVLILSITHLTLFIFATIDTHALRTGERSRLHRVHDLADRIVVATEKHAALRQHRRAPRTSPVKAAYRHERGRTLSRDVPAEAPLLGARRWSPEEEEVAEEGDLGRGNVGYGARLEGPFDAGGYAYEDERRRGSWEESFEEVSLEQRAMGREVV